MDNPCLFKREKYHDHEHMVVRVRIEKEYRKAQSCYVLYVETGTFSYHRSFDDIMDAVIAAMEELGTPDNRHTIVWKKI